jgi:hypothetical protein
LRTFAKSLSFTFQVDSVADGVRDEWYSELEKSFAQMIQKLEPMLKGTAGADKLQTLFFSAK